MCTKWSIEYAQIVTNMQQLLHLCIRDVNAGTCLVTPPPPGGGHVGAPEKARGVRTPRLGSGAPGKAGSGRAGGAG